MYTVKRATILTTLGVVAAILVALPAVGLAATDGGATSLGQADENGPADQANATAPGEQFSGVVGVGEAELEGEVEKRGFGIQLQRASPQGQADAINERFPELGERLQTLQDRKAQLEQQRADGEISHGKYSAQVARLSAQIDTLRGLTDQSETAAAALPDDIRGQVNVTAIQELRDRASELSGPEIAEIAHDIRGNGIGPGPGGPPGVGNSSSGSPGVDDVSDAITDRDIEYELPVERSISVSGNETRPPATDERPGNTGE